MKKTVSLLLAGALCIGMLAGCSGGAGSDNASASVETTVESAAVATVESSEEGSSAPATSEEEVASTKIDTLRIAFVPSREPEEIITATEPLKQMLTDELAKLGYEVGEVDITVGTSYEAVGEALSAGTADVGLIPGGTYVLYDDGCDVL